MSDLTAVIAAHAYLASSPRPGFTPLRDCMCGWKSTAGYGAQTLDWAAHVAAAIEEAATITTVEQADALPLGTCIRTAKGRFSVRNTVFDTWISQADLPARVLWTPGGGE